MEKQKITKGKWLEENGFSNREITYFILGNSYSIRNGLKEIGFKFSPLLRWHGPHNKYVLPPDCKYHEMSFNDLFVWNEELGAAFLKEDTREILDKLFNTPRESVSKYVGVVGDKIENIYVKVINCGGYDTAYGYRWFYVFLDENENEYIWYASVNKSLSQGMWVNLSGEIKDHKEYKGAKQTVLTRCKVFANEGI